MANLVLSKLGGTINWISASAGGDEMPNDGRTLLYIDVTGGGAVEFRVTEQRQCNFKHPLTDFVQSGLGLGLHRIGTWSRIRYNNKKGRIAIAFDDETNVKIAGVIILESD